MNYTKYLLILAILIPGSLFAARDALVYAVGGPTAASADSFWVASQVTLSPISGSPFHPAGFNTSRGIAMASDYSTVYMVTLNGTLNFVAVDVNSNTGLYSLTSSVSGPCFDMILTNDNNTAYFSAGGSNVVQIVDNLKTSPTLGGTISVNVPLGLAVSRDGNTLYVASNSDNKVYYYNITTPSTPTLGGSVDVSSQGTGCWGLALTDTTLYVCNNSSGNVSAIDITGTPTLITGTGYPISIGGGPYFIAIPANGPQANNFAYVTNDGGNNVSIIDLMYSPPTVVSTIGVGHHQENLTISADGSSVLIALFTGALNGTISVIDTATNTAGPSINIGTCEPLALAATKRIPPPNPPLDVTGQLTTTIIECPAPLTEETFTITWEGPDSPDIVSYNIYDNYMLVATVPVSPYIPPYTMYSHTFTVNSSYDLAEFSVTAVDDTDSESTFAPVTLLPPITIMGGSCSPSATGTIRNNVFLLQTQRILVITWTASMSSTTASYNIYDGTTLVGNVLATSPLIFNAPLANGDAGTNFFIAAVSNTGAVSTPSPVIVI